jgi:hypothetical protein
MFIIIMANMAVGSDKRSGTCNVHTGTAMCIQEGDSGGFLRRIGKQINQ